MAAGEQATQHFGGIRDEGEGGAHFDGTRCKVARSAGDESGRQTHEAYAAFRFHVLGPRKLETHIENRYTVEQGGRFVTPFR